MAFHNISYNKKLKTFSPGHPQRWLYYVHFFSIEILKVLSALCDPIGSWCCKKCSLCFLFWTSGVDQNKNNISHMCHYCARQELGFSELRNWRNWLFKTFNKVIGSLLSSKLRNWLRKITGICWKKWTGQHFLHPEDVVICQSSVHGKKIRFQSW